LNIGRSLSRRVWRLFLAFPAAPPASKTQNTFGIEMRDFFHGVRAERLPLEEIHRRYI
jgi:hypothetical protein